MGEFAPSPINGAAIMGQAQQLVPDPFADDAARLQRQQAALQIKAGQAQLDAYKQKLQRTQSFQQDLTGVLHDGSPQAISGLMMKYPEFSDQVKAGWDMKDKAARDSDLTSLSEIYSAAQGGHWDIAAKAAHARHDAEIASGQADPHDDDIISAIDQAAAGDPNAQKSIMGMLGIHLSAAMGPEHFAATADALNRGKGGYTLDAGAARYDDQGHMVAHSPFIQDADGNIRLWQDDGSGTPPPNPTAAPAAGGGFDNAVAHVLKNEGGYAAADLNGAPVNFGINAKANAANLKRMGVGNIKDLTRDQAVQIYKGYWDDSGAEQLPANMQSPYFDVYVRSPKAAQHALAASGGDPAKFMQLSSAYFQGLPSRNPKAQQYAKAWANRDADNLAIATGSADPATAAPANAAATADAGKFPIVIPGKGKQAPSGYQFKPDGTLEPIKGGPADKSGDVGDPLTKYGISPNMVGPDVLTRLPANLSNQVKALAEGRLPMPSSFALAKPYWQQMLQLTSQYDPSFDASTYQARKSAITAFTGNGKAAQTVGSVNRVANHLETLWNANKKLAGPETGWSVTNGILARAGQAFDPEDAKAYDTAVPFIAGELEKIARNSPGTEAGVDRIVNNLGRANSAKTREAAIKTAVEIISGAIDPLKDQYNSAFSTGSVRPNIPWVSPKAQKIYREIGGVDMSLTGPGAGGNSSADGGTPSGGRHPPAGATRTATGPNGQKAALVNGHWIPY